MEQITPVFISLHEHDLVAQTLKQATAHLCPDCCLTLSFWNFIHQIFGRTDRPYYKLCAFKNRANRDKKCSFFVCVVSKRGTLQQFPLIRSYVLF